jgi:hypothetical protein
MCHKTVAAAVAMMTSALDASGQAARLEAESAMLAATHSTARSDRPTST